MAKDPAFLFYPNDWLGGTIGMTLEEKGAYIDLLMMQFNRGHMTSHMVGQRVGQVWLNIQDKFVQDDKGGWFNKRLEEEQNKRKSFTASRNNNLSGINQHTKKAGHMDGHMVGHTTSHMENENRDININKNKFIKEEVLNNILKDIDINNIISSWQKARLDDFKIKGSFKTALVISHRKRMENKSFNDVQKYLESLGIYLNEDYSCSVRDGDDNDFWDRINKKSEVIVDVGK